MYILKCSDGTYYTGSTRDLLNRLVKHHLGTAANYTRKRRPVELVFFEEFDTIQKAFLREKQVQGWRREKKEALIKGQLNKLPELSSSIPSTGSGTERNEESPE